MREQGGKKQMNCEFLFLVYPERMQPAHKLYFEQNLAQPPNAGSVGSEETAGWPNVSVHSKQSNAQLLCQLKR